MIKSSNDNYLLDKFKILLEYIGKISARFLSPSISASKINFNCLRFG